LLAATLTWPRRSGRGGGGWCWGHQNLFGSGSQGGSTNSGRGGANRFLQKKEQKQNVWVNLTIFFIAASSWIWQKK